MATAKLDIKRELKAVDSRDYNFYNNLTDDEKKSFAPFILMRYTSSVQSDRDIEEWFLETTNEYVNKNFFLLSKNHKSLLWKLFAASGVGQSFYHPYLAAGKKTKAEKFEKLLAMIYPTYKMEDIKLLAKLMTKQEKDELFDFAGIDKKERKEYE